MADEQHEPSGATPPAPDRADRRHDDGIKRDQRHSFERDRDRILYSSAFRRLAGITQVVSAAEGHLFHNRLTHTLKVAQLGRRLAQHARASNPTLAEDLGVDPEVVEAAALAHDLGHPPFGHVGEYVLRDCVNRLAPAPRKADDVSDHDAAPLLDGYEGNAQSFRIVTKLAVRETEFRTSPGLNLTRATLAATLKYPWTHAYKQGARHHKWSAYWSEQADFDFACAGRPAGERSAEAELMDWADDLAYSVHDLEDFHRAGMIPWAYLLSEPRERDKLLTLAAEKLSKSAPHLQNHEKHVERAWDKLTGPFTRFREPYTGLADQRATVRVWTSGLIDSLFHGIALRKPTPQNRRTVEIKPESEAAITVLKSITWIYVIDNPALAAQQEGQRSLLEGLFGRLMEMARDPKRHRAFPARFLHLLPTDKDLLKKDLTVIRIVADSIASMTETEAIALHRRLFGTLPGTVLDPIFR